MKSMMMKFQEFFLIKTRYDLVYLLLFDDWKNRDMEW